ncbi:MULTISPECIES: Xaa-Pro peptidase family protein [unclassified Microbacterium]|uniref:M24 family metallopeptidase n=1 Tax=unclassified Microbacterium TaxID=2609290 RepID=UPI00214C2C61|nr:MULTISPECIES: Xaa-Pro peptidase family protein [unclassified Microbacterium]MCR2783219.1 Xaa-Pro peptidase family protein [Microbacterium sp. zg.B96]WIM15902.1 Xaa-Pro peptidase family protein [Microbacterium sp. zg-B96]
MRLPDEFYERVQNRVRRRLAERGLDGIIVTAPADVAYLIGFFYAVTERPVYLWFGADGSRFVLMPELDADYALAQNIQAEIRTYFEYPGTTRPEAHLAAALRDLGVRSERVGVTASLSVGARDALGDALPGTTFTRTAVVSELRVVKEPEEITLHRQAAEICDDMLDAGRRLIEEALAGGTPLPTESDLARHVIAYGTDRMYAQYSHVIYTTKLAGGLVYAGPNAARPHGLPSRRRLEVGDTLILSLGAAVASRFVESERTFIIGPPSRQQREFYAVAQRAQEVGTQAMVVGRTCADVNAEALDVIRDAGMGEYIRHRLGHGIGIAQHEPPWVEDGDPTVLVPGMILSSEPGIYVPGHAGYRISDSVLVTAVGPERLTRYPRQLEENVIT